MREIEISRLRFKRFTCENLYRVYSHPVMMRYVSPRTQAQTQTSLSGYIKQWEQHGCGMWAGFDKSAG